MRNLSIALCLFVVTAGGAVSRGEAATLTSVQGAVLVDRGNGFVLAQTGVDVSPGNRILVQSSASAQINFSNGKTQLLEHTGAVYTVPPENDDVAAVPETPAGGGTVVPGGLVIGGVAALAGAGVLIANSSKNGDKKTSPPAPSSP